MLVSHSHRQNQISKVEKDDETQEDRNHDGFLTEQQERIEMDDG